MLSLELAGQFYATIFMAQSIGVSIRFSKEIIFTGSESLIKKDNNNTYKVIYCFFYDINSICIINNINKIF